MKYSNLNLASCHKHLLRDLCELAVHTMYIHAAASAAALVLLLLTYYLSVLHEKRRS